MTIAVLFVCLVAAGVAVRFGAPWLLAHVVRPIRPEWLGFRCTGRNAELASAVGEAFRAGVRARLLPSRIAWDRRCDALDPHFRPFAFEGAAFGQGVLVSLHRRDWDSLRTELIAARPEHTYLFHVGVGFWAAFRYRNRFQPLIDACGTFDPLYRYLCADGYGFKFGFFDFMRRPSAVDHLRELPDYYRHAAWQGVGRAMFFAFLGDRPGLFETVANYAPDHDADLISGVGLAAAFARTHEPRRVIDMARAVPTEWRPHFHLGLTFGFKARALTLPGYYEQCLQQLPAAAADAVRSAVALCDQVEAEVRRECVPDGYRAWRERLTARMAAAGTWEPAYATALDDALARMAGPRRPTVVEGPNGKGAES